MNEYMDKGYLIGFSVISFGCCSRIWTGIERIKKSLVIATKTSV